MKWDEERSKRKSHKNDKINPKLAMKCVETITSKAQKSSNVLIPIVLKQISHFT